MNSRHVCQWGTLERKWEIVSIVCKLFTKPHWHCPRPHFKCVVNTGGGGAGVASSIQVVWQEEQYRGPPPPPPQQKLFWDCFLGQSETKLQLLLKSSEDWQKKRSKCKCSPTYAMSQNPACKCCFFFSLTVKRASLVGDPPPSPLPLNSSLPALPCLSWYLVGMVSSSCPFSNCKSY